MIQNDPRLFSGGIVEFPKPNKELYFKLLQQEQARNEALDQYYQNLHKNINPAGMRTKDIEGGWSKKVQDWTTHTIQNGQRIKNPKTPEDRALANQNMAMYQDILMDTNKSKEAGAQEMELAKLKLSGKWNPTQGDMEVSDALSSSIYSPGYYKDPDIRTKPYTLNDVSLNIPQVTPKEQEEYYKAAVGNLKPGKTYDEAKLRRDNISGQVFIPYQQSYEPDAVKKIGDNAGVLFPGNRTPIGVHYEKLLHDPNFFKEANQAYQSVYGEDQIVDTPKKAAQAAAIMNTRADISTGEEIRNDESLDFQRKKELMALNDAYAKGRMYMNRAWSQADKATQSTWVDGQIQGVIQKGKQKGQIVYDDDNGEKRIGFNLPLDGNMAEALKRDGVQPDALRLNSDGTFQPIFLYRNPDGSPKRSTTGDYEVNKIRSVPQTYEQIKAAYSKQFGQKQANLEMGGLDNDGGGSRRSESQTIGILD